VGLDSRAIWHLERAVVISSGLDRWSSVDVAFSSRGKKSLSLAPSLHWPEPVVVIDTNANEGPAITSIEYKSIPRLLKSSCKR